MRATLDLDDGYLYVEMRLNHRKSWYMRVFPAIRFLLGLPASRLASHYEEAILRLEDYPKLRALLDESERLHAHRYTNE